MALIEVESAWKIYPQPGGEIAALAEIDLAIESGEFVIVSGVSGSGKSTLLALLGALDRPTRGSVRILGHDLTTTGDRRLTELRRRHLGFVFQDFRLLSHLSAVENAALPSLVAGDRQGCREAVELLERFNLGHRMTHRPQALSRGEMQRVALARALVNRPELLLADEPTANLDPDNGRIIWRTLDELHRDRGLSIVVATPNPDLVPSGARTIYLAGGRQIRACAAEASSRA